MITLFPLVKEPCNFNVDETVRYQPFKNVCGVRTQLTPADSDSVGQIMKITAIRDIMLNPIAKTGRYRAFRSRYLLTCVRPDGQIRSFYDIHAAKV